MVQLTAGRLIRGASGLLVGLLFTTATLPALAQPTAQYRVTSDSVRLPDPAVTPGKARPASQDEVCSPGSARAARRVPAQVKRQVYAMYGVRPEKGVCCEVDHLISLELGGSNDVENLWPQPYEPRPGAHEKDVLENFLHRAVCGGAMSLDEAQQAIATDWYAAWKKMKGRE